MAANFNVWGNDYRCDPLRNPDGAHRLPVYVLSRGRDSLRLARTGPYTMPALTGLGILVVTVAGGGTAAGVGCRRLIANPTRQ